MQIQGGADPNKTFVVPNGVEFFDKHVEYHRNKKKTNTIGYVGRIVSIKDVKTFIRAMKIVIENIPEAEIYILGSGEEEEQYYNECRTLVQMLGLENNIVFTGNVDVGNYYPMFDVVVLTSISEAQPLSILEAMSYGVPVVASDVGSCKEIIIGRSDDDKSLGEAGIVTQVGNPHTTASAVIKILRNESMWKQMSDTGVERIKRHYRTDLMIDKYREYYDACLRREETTKKVKA